MLKSLTILAVVAMLSGMAMGQEQSAWIVSGKSPDAVWTAALDALAECGLSVQSADKASGMVISDWVSFKKKDGFCECKKAPAIQMEFDRAGKVTIRIKPAEDGTSEVKIDGAFKQTYGFKGPEKTRSCPSTGALEKKVLDAMKKALDLSLSSAGQDESRER